MEDRFRPMVYRHLPQGPELVSTPASKGFTILRPYGYAIWENIQRIMDGEFKKTITRTWQCLF